MSGLLGIYFWIVIDADCFLKPFFLTITKLFIEVLCTEIYKS